MTVRELKNFLNQGRCLRKRILAGEERLEEWERRAASIRSGLKEAPVQSSSAHRAVEDAACAIADIQAYIRSANGELAETERRISGVIAAAPLESVDKYILELRYLNGLTWEEIAVCGGYSYRRILQRHGAALHRMAQNCAI